LGVAAASLVAGVSIDLWGWRAAFIIPGVVCVATGLALWACIRIGWITPLAGDHRPAPPASRDDIIRAFVVLTITMLCAGLIYQAMSVVLPKLFAERLAMTAGMSATSLGAVVSAVYLVSGMAQLAGGYFSDWFSMKWTYVGSYLLQAPLLAMIALIDGWSLVGTTVVMMALMTAAAPAESGLLARYTPTRWRSTAFGAKFVLTLGVSALGVPLVSFLYGATGGFAWVFYVLAMLAATLFVSGLWIPGGPAAPAVRPVTATAPAE
ncbi:MAG: MFS transporter, partial [Alphaproteobacteria bacterium]|nr:MFS transporter [Alphaproteobacteria bacterium]